MRPRFSNKKQREAAFDLVLLKLDADAGQTDWVRNEMQIFLVRVSLGDAYAVVDLADGRLLSSAEASKLCEACLVIEESPNLQRVAERIVLTWTFELASGKPIDSRWQALIPYCR